MRNKAKVLLITALSVLGLLIIMLFVPLSYDHGVYGGRNEFEKFDHIILTDSRYIFILRELNNEHIIYYLERDTFNSPKPVIRSYIWGISIQIGDNKVIKPRVLFKSRDLKLIVDKIKANEVYIDEQVEPIFGMKRSGCILVEDESTNELITFTNSGISSVEDACRGRSVKMARSIQTLNELYKSLNYEKPDTLQLVLPNLNYAENIELLAMAKILYPDINWELPSDLKNLVRISTDYHRIGKGFLTAKFPYILIREISDDAMQVWYIHHKEDDKIRISPNFYIKLSFDEANNFITASECFN